jgi:hypothetical protein
MHAKRTNSIVGKLLKRVRLSAEKKQARKEVTLMKYAKPEITEAGASLVAIKGTEKASMIPLESGSVSYHFTPQAYEADE